MLANTAIAATTVSSLSAVALLVLLYYDHIYAFQPSALISIYLSISSLLDGAKVRSYFLRSDMGSVGGITAAVLVAKVMLVVIQEIPKRVDSKLRGTDKLNGDVTLGFWNRLLLFWINSTLFYGFRHRLTMAELGGLGPRFACQNLSENFEKYWNKGKRLNSIVFVRTIA